MSNSSKLKDITNILGALATPIIVATVGAWATLTWQNENTNARYVEFAVAILREPVDQSGKDIEFRTYAAEILQKTSPIPVSDDLKDALIKRSLSTTRVCLDDPFTDYANSLRDADKSRTVALETLSAGEAGSTIERTQTINLMRESLFRACEQYVMGALTFEQYKQAHNKTQKSMISILAIESLTSTTNKNPEKK